MEDTTLSERVGEKTAKSPENTGNLKTFHSGDNGNTTLTAPDIEKLENLTKEQALAQASEELAALLVVYHNLGGKLTALTLPDGKGIMAHQHVIILPAKRDETGAYALDVP